MWCVYEYTRCLACISYDQKKPMWKNERIIMFSFVFRVFLSFFHFTLSKWFYDFVSILHKIILCKSMAQPVSVYAHCVQYILYANKCFTFCLSYKEMFFCSFCFDSIHTYSIMDSLLCLCLCYETEVESVIVCMCSYVLLLSILRLCCGKNFIKSIPGKPNELVTTIRNTKTKTKREFCPNKNTKYIKVKRSIEMKYVQQKYCVDKFEYATFMRIKFNIRIISINWLHFLRTKWNEKK